MGTVPMADSLTTSPIDFDRTGKVLYLMDSRGRDTSAAFTLDLASGKETLVAEDPRCDVSDIILQPVDKTIQAVGFEYEKKDMEGESTRACRRILITWRRWGPAR